MRRVIALAAGLCLGLTACGSTVSQTTQAGLSGAAAPDSLGQLDPALGAVSSPDGSGVPALGGAAAPDAAGALTAPGGTTSASGPAATMPGGTTSESAGQPPAASGATQVDYTKPATGSPVDVGIMYIKDLGAAGANFGGNGEDQTGQRDYMKAAVQWMNAHGGLGGHKINLLYYGAEIAGSKSYDQSQEEMCAMMTEDNKAVATVIANITVTNNMAQCMQKARGLYVSDGGYFKSGADWSRLSYSASPSELDSVLLGRELAELTIARGAAKRGEKVGLLVYDAPGFIAAEGAFKKVAAANGIETKAYRITYANSTPELSNSIAAVQSAVLAFQSEDIKTVVSLSSGLLMAFFLNNADQQRYYPRYVLTSNDGPVNAPGAAKNNQLKGAIALGYSPTLDVDLMRQPALFSDSTFDTCRAINKQFPAASANATNFSISQRVCQALLLIQTAAKGHGGTEITGTTLRDGLRKVGTSIPAGSTYKSLFSPSKQWAPTHYRSLRYDEAANRFVYDSGLIPFS